MDHTNSRPMYIQTTIRFHGLIRVSQSMALPFAKPTGMFIHSLLTEPTQGLKAKLDQLTAAQGRFVYEIYNDNAGTWETVWDIIGEGAMVQLDKGVPKVPKGASAFDVNHGPKVNATIFNIVGNNAAKIHVQVVFHHVPCDSIDEMLLSAAWWTEQDIDSQWRTTRRTVGYIRMAHRVNQGAYQLLGKLLSKHKGKMFFPVLEYSFYAGDGVGYHRGR